VTALRDHKTTIGKRGVAFGCVSALAILGCALLLAFWPSAASASGFKNCGTKAPFQNPTKARGVGCRKARQVMSKWLVKSASSCKVDGSTCTVLGFTCRVPPANNFSNLICHRNGAVIFQHLVY
jgi:hypothetical protein